MEQNLLPEQQAEACIEHLNKVISIVKEDPTNLRGLTLTDTPVSAPAHRSASAVRDNRPRSESFKTVLFIIFFYLM